MHSRRAFIGLAAAALLSAELPLSVSAFEPSVETPPQDQPVSKIVESRQSTLDDKALAALTAALGPTWTSVELSQQRVLIDNDGDQVYDLEAQGLVAFQATSVIEHPTHGKVWVLAPFPRKILEESIPDTIANLVPVFEDARRAQLSVP